MAREDEDDAAILRRFGFEPDPVIEAYTVHVDRTLLRQKSNAGAARTLGELGRRAAARRRVSSCGSTSAWGANLGGIVAVLADAGAEFVVVGGLAAQAHGSARLTQDANFLYRRTSENIQRLTVALEPFAPYLRGAPPGLPFRFDPDTVKRGLNFTLSTSLGDVDHLGEIVGGGTYEDVESDCVRLEERPAQRLLM
jgi:hypothetical protein